MRGKFKILLIFVVAIIFLSYKDAITQSIQGSLTIRVNGEPIYQGPLKISSGKIITPNLGQLNTQLQNQGLGSIMSLIQSMLYQLVQQLLGGEIAVPAPAIGGIMPPHSRTRIGGIPIRGNVFPGTVQPQTAEEVPIAPGLNAETIREVLRMFPQEVLGLINGIYPGAPSFALGATDGHNIYLNSEAPGVIAHECGHVLHLSGLYPEFNNAVARAYAENPSAISWYGSTNIYEFAAEVIKAYLTGGRGRLEELAQHSQAFKDLLAALDKIFIPAAYV